MNNTQVRILAFLVMFALAAAVASAQVPKSLNEIPSYPGLKRDAAREQKKQSFKDYKAKNTKGFKSIELLEFTVDASTEDLLLWYMSKLDMDAGNWKNEGEYLSSKGGAAPFEASIQPVHSNSRSEGDMGPAALPYFKKMNRKKVGDAYVWSAAIRWKSAEQGDAVSEFAIYINDDDFLIKQYDDGSAEITGFDKIRSDVQFVRVTSQSKEALAKRQAEADAAAAAKAEANRASVQKAPKAEIPKGEPKADYLGVPVYPGAKYLPDMSGDMQSGGLTAFAWTSDDAPSAVADFYGKLPGFTKNQGGQMYSVNGLGAPGTRINIMIQPPEAMNRPELKPAKSIIIVMKL
jgi:hypothetical protein